MSFIKSTVFIATIFLGLTTHQKAMAQCEVLVWSDEFDGTGAPNSAYWNYDLGAGGWGNNEVQSYTNSTTNVRQENGNLIIEAIKSGNNWTSGRIKTQGKKGFTYGKIVYRAKLPSGVGTWPALWMLGESITSAGWPACGEIDVMEHVGKNQNVVQSALHTPSSFGNTQNKGSKTVSTVSTEFHEYAVSWNAERMIFSIDDIPFYTYKPTNKTAATWPFNANQFIIINIAMGGNFGGPIDAAVTSAKMEVDYVRVYEERTAPLIDGRSFLFENEQGIQYKAPDYGNGITYDWTVPVDATIVNGQGTNQVTVNWGPTDGTINLVVNGDTGCTDNTASLNVTTIVEPTGLKYTIENFSNPLLPGWTKNDNTIALQTIDNHLKVDYNLSSLKYIQYEMPKAVHLSNYSIIKLPVRVESASAIPNLLLTLRDGDGKETITTNFEIKVVKNDGNFYTYSFNFKDQWNLNSPAVNDNFIKSLRIYMLPGQSSFQLGAIEMYNNTTIPEAPSDLSASIDDQGKILLSWMDGTNATSFNLYRSSNTTDPYIKIKSSIKTSEIPYAINPTEAINYYKLSGVNNSGESPLSSEIEVVATITGTEPLSNSLISVYPNPCNGRFFINTNGGPIKNLKIFDSKGRTQSFETIQDNTLLIVDLKSISSGIYFIILNQESKTFVAKIVIN